MISLYIRLLLKITAGDGDVLDVDITSGLLVDGFCGAMQPLKIRTWWWISFLRESGVFGGDSAAFGVLCLGGMGVWVGGGGSLMRAPSWCPLGTTVQDERHDQNS